MTTKKRLLSKLVDTALSKGAAPPGCCCCSQRKLNKRRFRRKKTLESIPAVLYSVKVCVSIE